MQTSIQKFRTERLRKRDGLVSANTMPSIRRNYESPTKSSQRKDVNYSPITKRLYEVSQRKRTSSLKENNTQRVILPEITPCKKIAFQNENKETMSDSSSSSSQSA